MAFEVSLGSTMGGKGPTRTTFVPNMPKMYLLRINRPRIFILLPIPLSLLIPNALLAVMPDRC